MIRYNSQVAVRKAVTDLSLYPKPLEKIHGFTFLRAKRIPELELTAFHLKHDKTGADYIHIAREDDNNVFSIGFKTNPPDNTGVPHILEHTTLCGSQKYPIRDPFFKMLPRTLSNFMNAMTAPSYTFYPFATTNNQDFKNLMSIYFDATLHPLLKPSDFFQEGWRIGPENFKLNDSSEAEGSDIKMAFKGVVYNEMKGQMSDSGYLYYIRFLDRMFPDLNNAGGDPQKITDLTYEHLKKFHADHYHPSNAKVFTYGNMPLTDHLKELDSQFSSFEKIEQKFDPIKPIDLRNGSREFSVTGPLDVLMPTDMQFKRSISWIMSDTANIVETFSLEILSSLLMDGYGSPLYQELISSGIGIDWSPNSGHDTSGRVGIFSVGLTGVKKENLEKIKEVIMKTLRKIHVEGLDDSKVKGFLHQMEISLKRKTANFGMGLLNRVKPHWFQGVDPFDCLKWNDILSGFEAEYSKGGYLEGLLEKYLLNENTMTFTMIPSETYAKEIIEEEFKRLAEKMEEITREVGKADAFSKLLKMEQELLQEQSKTKTEDLSCLPTVYIKDIPRKKESVEVTETRIRNATVQWRQAPTNGLTYFRAISVFDNLPTELRELIPLFTDSIFRLGTSDMTMEQLEDLMKLKTGSLTVSYFSSPSPFNLTSPVEGIIFTGTALDRNVPDMFQILRKLVVETNFDSPDAANRIKQLLQASSDGATDAVASRGHSYAMSAAEIGFGDYFWKREQVKGLTQVKLITTLANRSTEEGLYNVIQNLKRIQRLAFSGSSFRTAVTCGSESVSTNETTLQNFIDSIPVNSLDLQTKSPKNSMTKDIKIFYPLPYQVYYGALSLPTVPYTSPACAPLKILSKLLSHKYMHHEIREKGGAYGAGASSRSLEGIFSFYSYRDPNPRNTISVIQNAGKWAAEMPWNERDLEEAKISAFQRVDAPQSVSSEGLNRFLTGITDEMAQEQRERLLDVTKEQVQEVSQKYIVEGLDSQKKGLVFIGKLMPWVDKTWKILDLGILSNSRT